jgi:hypothetical protein
MNGEKMKKLWEAVTLWCLAAAWSFLVCGLGLVLLTADRLRRD